MSLFPTQSRFRPANGNMLFLYRPNPGVTTELAPLRSHRYNIGDDFSRDAAEILSRGATSGATDSLAHILDEARRRQVVSLTDRPSALFDYSAFDELWKFVLYLNKFPGQNAYMNYTVVLTGVCSEEPTYNGRMNEKARLIVEHRTVIQSYTASTPYGGTAQGHRTPTDSSYLYGSMVESASTRHDLYENRPSSFNLTPVLQGLNETPSFSGDPMFSVTDSEYSSGPTQYNRFHAVPDVVVRDILDGVEKNIRRRGSDRGYGGSEMRSSVNDPNFDVANVAEHFKRSDASGGVVTQHLGPEVSARLSLTVLEQDWGIKDAVIMDPPKDRVWHGEDPTSASTRNIYYGLIETMLPAFAANKQIIKMSMDVTSSLADFGKSSRVPRLHDGESYVLDLTEKEVADRCYEVFDALDAAVFSQLEQAVGGFSCTIDLNMTGVSYVNLQFYDEANNPDSVYSFTSAYNNFAIPLISTERDVRDNQQSLGGMLHRVFSEQDNSTSGILDFAAQSTDEYDRNRERDRRGPPRLMTGGEPTRRYDDEAPSQRAAAPVQRNDDRPSLNPRDPFSRRAF